MAQKEYVLLKSKSDKLCRKHFSEMHEDKRNCLTTRNRGVFTKDLNILDSYWAATCLGFLNSHWRGPGFLDSH